MTLEVPGTIRIPVGVVAERRPGVTAWAPSRWYAACKGTRKFPPAPMPGSSMR